jgi:hypothetical protein
MLVRFPLQSVHRFESLQLSDMSTACSRHVMPDFSTTSYLISSCCSLQHKPPHSPSPSRSANTEEAFSRRCHHKSSFNKPASSHALQRCPRAVLCLKSTIIAKLPRSTESLPTSTEKTTPLSAATLRPKPLMFLPPRALHLLLKH